MSIPCLISETLCRAFYIIFCHCKNIIIINETQCIYFRQRPLSIVSDVSYGFFSMQFYWYNDEHLKSSVSDASRICSSIEAAVFSVLDAQINQVNVNPHRTSTKIPQSYTASNTICGTLNCYFAFWSWCVYDIRPMESQATMAYTKGKNTQRIQLYSVGYCTKYN